MNNSNTPVGAEVAVVGTDVPEIRVFLVQEADMFIAEDIISSLKATGTCRVIDVREFDQIGPVLEAEPYVTAAFLETPFAEVKMSKVAAALLHSGARIILTTDEGGARDALAAGWGLLTRPFTEPMIHEALISDGAVTFKSAT